MGLKSIPAFVVWKQRKLFTIQLVVTVLYMSLASFNFGYDVSLFSSIQGMNSFTREFGQYDQSYGGYRLPSYLSSIMNSTPFAGKLIGTLSAGPLMKRYGRKSAVLYIAVISIVGVVLQCSTKTAAQFTVGRILCYLATGVTIAVVPTYQSETAPAELRGAIVATLQLWLGLGQLIGAVVTNATQARPGRDAWLIPTALQLVVPCILLAGYKFIPESPRWLLWNGRREDALKSLQYIRSSSATVESLDYELDLIHAADMESSPGFWKELLQGSNRRRTMIAVCSMVSQQCTGQVFSSQYSVVFYQQQGITSPSPYVLTVIGNATSLLALFIVSIIVDTFGRRPILFVGGSLMALWLFILGGLGTIADKHELSEVNKNVLVAANMLYTKAYGMSWAPLAYIIMSEVPTNRLREKTVLIATSCSVIVTFLTSFTLPYLLNAPYANLGAKVGFLYGSICVVTVLWAIFFLPELKNRSLEELDEMFEKNLSVFSFRKYESEGIGKQIHDLETKHGVSIKVKEEV